MIREGCFGRERIVFAELTIPLPTVVFELMREPLFSAPEHKKFTPFKSAHIRFQITKDMFSVNSLVSLARSRCQEPLLPRCFMFYDLFCKTIGTLKWLAVHEWDISESLFRWWWHSQKCRHTVSSKYCWVVRGD